MNIKILDSWLREFLNTKASARQIAEQLSLTSVSVERVEKYKNDFIYDIEVTTNRPDFASVVGIAREAGAVLPQVGIPARFLPPKLSPPSKTPDKTKKTKITIDYDPKLVNRICAVVMEVKQKPSPEVIKERLETSDIRSLNNLIDITNYVMRTVGHPTHVFDFDRLNTDKLMIREAKSGEKVTTLDGKAYTLAKGDMVAVDTKGRIVDLLAIMGLENSVVQNDTKRILFFINNHEPTHIRKTSMRLGIRTEAAQLNEKGVDSESAMDALLYGIQLYKDLAGGEVISEIIDLYPNKVKLPEVKVSFDKINSVIGIAIPQETVMTIVKDLGFETSVKGEILTVKVPSFRALDISIPEDVIEEVARVYGYYKIPSAIPSLQPYEISSTVHTSFYLENKIRSALKYWGFTEVYTYPMVSEATYEGEKSSAVKLANPLGEEFVYMRRTLLPSLRKVIEENKRRHTISIFEIANVYEKSEKNVPAQTPHLAIAIKDDKGSFFTGKGILESLFQDLNIQNSSYKPLSETAGAEIGVGKNHLGTIKVHGEVISIEVDLEKLFSEIPKTRKLNQISKFPPAIEDLAFIVPASLPTAEVISEILSVDSRVTDASLLDRYKDARTFHVVYQDKNANLTSDEITQIRSKLVGHLRSKFNITPKD